MRRRRQVGGHQPDSHQPRPAWTWHDVSIGFRLSVARRPAAAVMSSALPTDVHTVVDAFGPATRSDAPDTQSAGPLLLELEADAVLHVLGCCLKVAAWNFFSREDRLAAPLLCQKYLKLGESHA